MVELEKRAAAPVSALRQGLHDAGLAAIPGALLGGGAGYATSEREGTDRLKDALKGALVGGGATGLAGGLGSGLKQHGHVDRYGMIQRGMESAHAADEVAQAQRLLDHFKPTWRG